MQRNIYKVNKTGRRVEKNAFRRSQDENLNIIIGRYQILNWKKKKTKTR